MLKWLYRSEANAIQQYVLRSQRLREILGASALVESLSGALLEEVLAEAGGSYETEVAAAGGATIKMDDDALRRFAVLWPRRVATFAPGLLVTQAWVPLQEGANQRLMARLREVRNTAPFRVPVGNPVLDRASRGSLPGVRTRKGQIVDAMLAAQSDAGEPGGALLDALEKRFQQNVPSGMSLATELNQIASEGQYLAVIHADGNNVGSVVTQLDDERWGPFSRALTTATLKAVREAADALIPRRGRTILGRPIVVGGDDITIITRADRALPFVESFCAAFHRNTQHADIPGGPLTATAGIAFVRRTHPFRQALELAHELCSWAKFNGRSVDADHSPSLVAFQRVSTTFGADFGIEGAGQASGRLGPYAVLGDDAHGFPPLSTLRRIARFTASDAIARGPLRELTRLLRVDPDQAPAHFARVADTHMEDDKKKAWVELSQELEALRPGLSKAPFVTVNRAGEDGRPDTMEATPWFDILDVAGVEHRGGYR